ncbi:hypothetical protein D3C73_1133820 [compost metagenome]
MLRNKHRQPLRIAKPHFGEQSAVGQLGRAFGVVVVSQSGTLSRQLEDHQHVVVSRSEQPGRKILLCSRSAGHGPTIALQGFHPVQPEVPDAGLAVAVGLEVPRIVQRVEPQGVHVTLGYFVALQREVPEPQLLTFPDGSGYGSESL